MKSAGFLSVIAFLVLSAQAQMQQGERPLMPQDEQNDVQPFCFYEAINLVADDSTKSRIDIPYRVDEQFFVAVRNTNTSLPFPFCRHGEVMIELVDKDGISKARTINRIELGARSTENTSDAKKWYEGIISFTVAPGEYTIVFEIDDLESERRFLDRKRKIVAQKFDGAKLQTSTIMLVAPISASPELAPLNFGGNIAFGKDASIFLQLYSNTVSTASIRVEYSVSTLPFFLQESKVVLSDTLKELPLLPLSNIILAQGSETPRYTFAESKHKASTVAAVIPLNAEKLPLRPLKIEMKITQGSTEIERKENVRMIWPDMPLSLRDVDFALEALVHITRPEELDSLQSGSRDTRLTNLESFWKKKDRTPNTEYNEVMVEYYRRVDHTQRTFSSMKGFDGYKSDRGRIYILHGPPSRTERTLDPNAGYQEVWYYESKNKKFTFVDRSKSGNYTLVATQNL